MDVDRLFRILGMIIPLFILSGCTAKTVALKETLSLAFLKQPDASISQQDLSNFPYACMYATYGDHPRAFLVLAFAEKNHSNAHQAPVLKWLTSKQEMLVTEAGRIMKTVDFEGGDFLASQSEMPDPLALGLHRPETPKYWTRQVDWQPNNYFNVSLHSKFVYLGEKWIDFNETQIKSLHYREDIQIPTLDSSMTNHFWLNPETGSVISSIQYISPFHAPLALTLIKPFSGEV